MHAERKMLLKFFALVVLFGFAIGKKCPDRTQCQKGSTCCQLKGGRYTCCPLPNALCCPDKEHCCPQGYSCDNETDACKLSASSTHPLLKAFASSHTKGNYVTCGTGEYLCPDGFTCCESGDIKYNCCPLPNAVCCPDKQHCCPQGYNCDNETDTCKPSASFIHPLLEIFANSQTKGNYVICGKGEYRCNDGFICCKLGGGYTCCPLIIADCCSTGCCPSETNSQDATAKPRVKTSLLKPAHQLGDKTAGSLICPDGKKMCSDNDTCCPMVRGAWGCCSLPEATCCKDLTHCCPHGLTCVEGGFCTKLSDSFAKSTLKAAPTGMADVVCPNGKFKCPDGYTCCKAPDGSWSCCPLKNAVCCDDHIHCCPEGSVCNKGKGKCDSKVVGLVPWSLKVKAIPIL